MDLVVVREEGVFDKYQQWTRTSNINCGKIIYQSNCRNTANTRY